MCPSCFHREASGECDIVYWLHMKRYSEPYFFRLSERRVYSAQKVAAFNSTDLFCRPTVYLDTFRRLCVRESAWLKRLVPYVTTKDVSILQVWRRYVFVIVSTFMMYAARNWHLTRNFRYKTHLHGASIQRAYDEAAEVFRGAGFNLEFLWHPQLVMTGWSSSQEMRFCLDILAFFGQNVVGYPTFLNFSEHFHRRSFGLRLNTDASQWGLVWTVNLLFSVWED